MSPEYIAVMVKLPRDNDAVYFTEQKLTPELTCFYLGSVTLSLVAKGGGNSPMICAKTLLVRACFSYYFELGNGSSGELF